MDARLLVHFTNVALVGVVGMTAGHTLMPTRPGTSAAAKAAFVASVAAAGALAGWRERREAVFAQGGPVPGSLPLWLGAGATAALLLAAIAWWLVHR